MSHVLLLLKIAAGYLAFNIVNHYATQTLYFETGAHLIHLPSGLRLVIVLVSGVLGATAIAIATFPYAYFLLFKDNLPLSMLISLTTPLIPLVTLTLVKRFVPWKINFSDLNLQKLFILAVTYATTNATVQQFTYHLFDLASRPLNAWLVMFAGDILGIVIVLYALRIIGKVFGEKKGR